MVKGKIILSGGGGSEDSRETDKYFVQLLPSNPKILYIPIAINVLKHPYISCLEWLQKTLNPFGVREIVMLTNLINVKVDIKVFDAIYIGGGNTFKLLNDLRNSGFDKILTKYYRNGGVVYGGSAGAIVLGNDIKTASSADTNDVGITDTKGLNLLENYAIWCHYRESDDEKIKEYMKASVNPVIALSEKTGLGVLNQKFKVLGTNSGFLFKGNKKLIFSPGEEVPLTAAFPE